MVIEISEREMILRFVDALSQSASAASQLSRPSNPDQPQALVDFIHGLKVAAGSAHQLGIYRENLKMLSIRDLLENIIEVSNDIIATSASENPYWIQIQDFLKEMSKQGAQIADSKPQSRLEVLADLDIRARNAGTDTIH